MHVRLEPKSKRKVNTLDFVSVKKKAQRGNPGVVTKKNGCSDHYSYSVQVLHIEEKATVSNGRVLRHPDVLSERLTDILFY